MRTLLSILEHAAQQFPDRPALETESRPPLTYSSLLQRVQHLSQNLRDLGLHPEDRIAVVLPNGPEMAAAFLATACAGVSAPLNPAYSLDEFVFYLRDLEARALVTIPGCSPPSVQAAQNLGIAVHPIEIDSHAPAGTWSFSTPPAGITRASSTTKSPDKVRRPEAHDIALVLHTSGTTSRPKLVPLSHANLVSSAEGIARGLKLTSEDRCLNIMPLFHVHGLVGALLSSLQSGACTICTPGFSAEQFGRWLKLFRPTWYTAVPTMHQAILSRPPEDFRDEPSSFRFIRSCSAALPPSVMHQLEERFKVPVIEAYGMTEASHQMASNPLPPGARKPGSVGQCTMAAIAILDPEGRELPPGTPGEVAIRGNNVTPGYANNPEANAQSWTQGWFRTGDMGHLDPEGYLFLTGRLKEIINRGGEKISPREVDEALLEHPGVGQAVAFGRPHPTLGEDVCAAVVLRTAKSHSETELRDFAMQRLAAFKVPSRILVLETIPKGPTGKIQRVGLAAKLAQYFQTECVAPRDLLESLTLEIWGEVFGHTQFGVRENFFGLGGDSLKAGRIIARLDETFEITLPRTAIFQHPTIEHLAQYLGKQIPPDQLRALEELMKDVMSSDPGQK